MPQKYKKWQDNRLLHKPVDKTHIVTNVHRVQLASCVMGTHGLYCMTLDVNATLSTALGHTLCYTHSHNFLASGLELYAYG